MRRIVVDVPELVRVQDEVVELPLIELVEVDVPRIGTMSVSLNGMPELKTRLRDQELAAAAAAGVDTLATVFHACHRELAHYDSGQPYEIINFMELVGTALGIEAVDLYKRYRQMEDGDAVVRSRGAKRE